MVRNRERTDHKAVPSFRARAKKPDSDEKVAQRLLQAIITQSGIVPRRRDESPRVLIAFGELSAEDLSNAQHSVVRSTHPDNITDQDRVRIIDRVLDDLQKRGVIEAATPIKTGERVVFLSRKTLDLIERMAWYSHPKFGNDAERVATLKHWSRLTATAVLKSV